MRFQRSSLIASLGLFAISVSAQAPPNPSSPLRPRRPLTHPHLAPTAPVSREMPVHSPPITSMKLLNATVGWAATDETLYWTADAGAHWKDITPRSITAAHLSSPFFLGPSLGWVLMSHRLESRPNVDQAETKFDLATTSDAGGTWSFTAIDVPDPDPSSGLSDHASIYFLDPVHGWIMARVNRGSGPRSFGVLLKTEDGGKTWTSEKTPPIASSPYFVSATDGWLAGEGQLFATHDGGANWREQSLPAPSQAGPATLVYDYYPPVFQDSKRGLLLVSYESPDGSVGALVTFNTDDGGRTWKAPRVLPQEFKMDNTSFAVEPRFYLETSRPSRTEPVSMRGSGQSISSCRTCPNWAPARQFHLSEAR
jgi:photosystem II stability/assembly factor-like uncharacterized protein